MKLVDAHPKRPPATAAVDVEEVVASHGRLQTRAPFGRGSVEKPRPSSTAASAKSSTCHSCYEKNPHASLCRTQLSLQIYEVSLKGGQASSKVVGDRGVREPRDEPHTDQTLTLGETSGPRLRRAESALSLDTTLRMPHAGFAPQASCRSREAEFLRRIDQSRGGDSIARVDSTRRASVCRG